MFALVLAAFAVLATLYGVDSRDMNPYPNGQRTFGVLR